MIRLFSFLLPLIVPALMVATIWPWLDDDTLTPELLGQAQLHIGIISATIALLWWIMRRKLAAFMCFTLAIINLGWIIVALPWNAPGVAPKNAWSLKVMSFNALVTNYYYKELTDLINQSDADVIWLQEIRSRDVASLINDVKARYPFAHRPKDKRLKDVSVLLSRHPIIDAHTAKIDDGTYYHFMRHATIIADEETVEFLGVHVRSPKSSARVKARNWQFSQTAEYINTHISDDSLFILAGDFNSAPWRPSFQRLLNAANLVPALTLTDISFSWPTWLPSPLAVPIDHIITRPTLCATPQQSAPNVGSDHYPVTTTLWRCK